MSVVYGKHHLHDPAQRPLKIIVVGAGPSGIATLIRLKTLAHISFECFEKNAEVGGTWLETRYPGAACDVASHAYQYSFHPKKDWSRHFAPAVEIGEYFISVAKHYKLYHHITFNSRAIGAAWDNETSKWKIKIATHDATKQRGTFVAGHEADIFINTGGILNAWKWPDIDGLHNFQGQLIHTAAWDSSIDLNGKKVGIIGSGASSIQVVLTVQPSCHRLDVYVRSPTYILPTVGVGIESSAFNQVYTLSQIDQFSADDAYYKAFRKRIEQLELGCRRVTPGLPYLNAVQEPNVNIIRSNLTKISENGIHTDDGEFHDSDIIICATGFNTSFNHYEIRGKNGVSLDEKWISKGPQAYLGTAISGFPNYFTILGPNCPIANGSLIPCIESSVEYIVSAILKMQRDQIKTIEVNQQVEEAFNEYVQSVHEDLVWAGACNSWYKDRRTGRVTAVWSGSSIHLMEMLEVRRWEDYKFEYMHGNPFMFMGDGRSTREFKQDDLTYYLDK